jgi:hypothetical protein
MLTGCVVELVPPLIRDALVSDAALRRDFSLTLDASISLDDANASFKRSALYAAVRATADSPGKPKKVVDEAGMEWEVVVRKVKGDAWNVVMTSGTRILYPTQLCSLHG